MTRAVGAVVMLMLGGACLRLILGGTYVNYVKEVMYLPLLASGIILVVLALIGLFRETTAMIDGYAGEGDGHEDGHGHDDGHGHGHGEPRVAWLLIIPVLAIYVVPPPALGADSIDRGGSRVTAPISPYGPLPAGDVVDLTMREFVERSVYDTTNALDGRTVRLTGFAVPADDGDAAFTLARVSMFCCAADGYAFTTNITGTDERPGPDAWLTVTGTLVPFEGEVDAYSVPELAVQSMDVIERPENAYE